MSSSTLEIKQTPFSVYVYFSIIPKKKKKIYKVLEFSELEYCRNKINCILCLCLFVDNPNKKKKKKSYKVLKLGELEYRKNKIDNILFIKGTRAWYTRVLCCTVLEYSKLEYHIIFFNRPISTSAMPRWQNF